MTFTRRTVLTAAAAALFTAASFQPALAAEVAGVKFDDTITVAGQQLRLNGLGVRTKVVFKVYAIGLYLTDKRANVTDVMAAPGPRRVQIVTLRELTAEEFSKAFSSSLNDNTSPAEQAKFAPQIKQFNDLIASVSVLKKGDNLTLDWLPDSGMQVTLNGKNVGATVQDLGFYNALLRIWLGENPVETSLKPKLLGRG